MTDRQRPEFGGRGKQRRRRRKRKPADSNKKSPRTTEPIMITARRPNSPLVGRAPSMRGVAASASPRPEQPAPAPKPSKSATAQEAPPRRSARIVELKSPESDQLERKRERMLERVLRGHGRLEITRSVNEFVATGFVLPAEPDVMLQLLEHFDERRVREAMGVLVALLEKNGPPKRSLLEERLKRLEEYAEETATREAAAELRRTLRSAQERRVSDAARA